MVHTGLLGLAYFLNTFEALESWLQPLAVLWVTMAIPALDCETLGNSIMNADRATGKVKASLKQGGLSPA